MRQSHRGPIRAAQPAGEQVTRFVLQTSGAASRAGRSACAARPSGGIADCHTRPCPGAELTGTGQSVPVGCHVCEVEVDPETGHVTVVAFAVAQDSGLLVNPMLVEGQLHGGVAQGVGQGGSRASSTTPAASSSPAA